MSDENDPIGKALGVNPMASFDAVRQLEISSHDDSAKRDFEHARANIYGLIENGNQAMEKLAQIAESSQHPRAFEVLAKMMDTMMAANQKLLDLQGQIRDIDTADAPMNDKAKTINNNLFVGTTAELQKMIQELKDGTKP